MLGLQLLTDGGGMLSMKPVPGMHNGVFQGDHFLPPPRPAGYHFCHY